MCVNKCFLVRPCAAQICRNCSELYLRKLILRLWFWSGYHSFSLEVWIFLWAMKVGKIGVQLASRISIVQAIEANVWQYIIKFITNVIREGIAKLIGQPDFVEVWQGHSILCDPSSQNIFTLFMKYWICPNMKTGNVIFNIFVFKFYCTLMVS